MKPLPVTNPEEALTAALVIGILSPSSEIEQWSVIAAKVSLGLDDAAIERCKAVAEQRVKEAIEVFKAEQLRNN